MKKLTLFVIFTIFVTFTMSAQKRTVVESFKQIDSTTGYTRSLTDTLLNVTTDTLHALISTPKSIFWFDYVGWDSIHAVRTYSQWRYRGLNMEKMDTYDVDWKPIVLPKNIIVWGQ